MSISRKMVKWWSSPTCNHEKENSRTETQSCPRHTVRYRKQVKKYELWPPSVKKKPLLFFTQIRLISAGDGWTHAYQCSFWRVWAALHVLSQCFNFLQTRFTLIINFKNEKENRPCRWKEGSPAPSCTAGRSENCYTLTPRQSSKVRQAWSLGTISGVVITILSIFPNNWV